MARLLLRSALPFLAALAACTTAATETTSDVSPTSMPGAEGSSGSGPGPGGDPSPGGGSSSGGSSSGSANKDAGVSNNDGGDGGGTACTTCGSELIASDPQNSILYGVAWNIAVDDTNVYVARLTGSNMASVPKNGGTLTPYALGHYGNILSLVEADAYLYYIRHYQGTGYVTKLSKAGGTPVSLFSVAASSIYFDNLVASDGALWFSSPSTAGGATRDVRKIDLATDEVTVVHPNGNWLAANTTHVFWMSSSKLMAAPKNGSSAPAEIAFLGTIPEVIWARNDAVFVGSEGEIELKKISTTAPNTETTLNTAVKLSRSSEEPTPRYVDGSYAYVIADSASPPGIYRVPTAGGPAQLFATDTEPLGLTGDATHIYWTNRDREVRRKAK